MRVRQIMTSPVVTVPSSTTVPEAVRLMKEKNIERLPIVDHGRLVGLVTKDRLLRATPSMASSLSLHEIHYLIAKLTLGEIMQTDVFTVMPDTTVENAVRLAQEMHVGCLPVVEDGNVVGILTTNDFFYVVLNPLLGIGEAGSRVSVTGCTTPSQLATALECAGELGLQVLNAAYLPSRRGGERAFIVHVDADDAAGLVERMRARGLDAEVRSR
jgi:acetoin utilization protein AcuB